MFTVPVNNIYICNIILITIETDLKKNLTTTEKKKTLN